MAVTMMASAGSFAAVSTLLGSPILGAFLIMEVAGVGGATLSLVALPGLLASGIGALIFLGLDNWTGLGTFSLALTHRAAAVSIRPSPLWPGPSSSGIVGAAAGLADPLGRAVPAADRAPQPGAGHRGPRPADRR